MPLDILMTLVSIVLMGGAYLFPADIVHEILGVTLFVLWAVHVVLNRRWYASLAQASKLITSTNANDRRSYGAIFLGQYNGRRVLQTVINCGILICTIFLMISGIILSKHIFTFLGIENLVWALNRVVGQHNFGSLQKIVDGLKKIDENNGNYKKIVRFLDQMGRI